MNLKQKQYLKKIIKEEVRKILEEDEPNSDSEKEPEKKDSIFTKDSSNELTKEQKALLTKRIRLIQKFEYGLVDIAKNMNNEDIWVGDRKGQHEDATKKVEEAYSTLTGAVNKIKNMLK